MVTIQGYMSPNVPDQYNYPAFGEGGLQFRRTGFWAFWFFVSNGVCRPPRAGLEINGVTKCIIKSEITNAKCPLWGWGNIGETIHRPQLLFVRASNSRQEWVPLFAALELRSPHSIKWLIDIRLSSRDKRPTLPRLFHSCCLEWAIQHDDIVCLLC